MEHKTKGIIIGTLAGMSIFVIFMFVLISQIRMMEMDEKIKITDKVNELSQSLMYQITSRTFINKNFESIIAKEGMMDSSDFNYYAEKLSQGDPIIKNIALMKETTVIEVYPYEANVSLIGVDLGKIDGQKEAIFESIESKKMVSVGPIDLVQGGTGIINRMPIFNNKSQNYWGMLSVVLSMDDLLENSGFNSDENKINYAIGSKDSHENFSWFYGNQEILLDNPIEREFVLNDKTLIIYATPENGWVSNFHKMIIGSIVSVILSSLIGFSFGYLIYSRQELKDSAYIDQLTHAYNRTMLYENVSMLIGQAKRNEDKMALLFLDVDNFKQINDTYGHIIGDEVLILISEKLCKIADNPKYVIRFGGDEFIVIVPPLGEIDHIHSYEMSIETLFNDAFSIKNINLDINVSHGLAIYPEDGRTAEELISYADAQMYMRKNREKTGIIYLNELSE